MIAIDFDSLTIVTEQAFKLNSQSERRTISSHFLPCYAVNAIWAEIVVDSVKHDRRPKKGVHIQYPKATQPAS